jgi:hypothetical protein
MPLALFSVEMVAGKPPRVFLNQVELSPDVFTLVGVRCEPGALPQLLLEAAGEAVIEGEGVVVVNPDVAEAEAIERFLGGLDVEEVTRRAEAVLNDPEWTDGRPDAHVVEALRRMVRVAPR